MDSHETFHDYLREVYGETVTMCGYDYDTAETFRDTDPIAYREAFLNWLDANNMEED